MAKSVMLSKLQNYVFGQGFALKLKYGTTQLFVDCIADAKIKQEVHKP